jgi:ankyrin repeat protein
MGPDDHRLAAAIERDDVAAVRACLAYGADPNACDDDIGWSMVELAVSVESVGSLRALVEFGASLAARAGEREGVLHRVVASRDQPVMLQVLLEMIPHVNAPDQRGWTPLHLAAAYGYEGSVRLLLGAEADPSAVTADGLTPADVAAANGHHQVAQLLRDPPTRFH